MDTNKMREQFEAWVKTRWPETEMGKFNTGEYHGFTLEHCWKAWQASREAVVVDLPPVRPEPVSTGDALKADGESATWNMWAGEKLAKEDCREAIKAQGLKVKP